MRNKVEHSHAGDDKNGLSNLEAQMAAMSIGFTAGRASTGEPATTSNQVAEFIGAKFCPVCIAQWLEHNNSCCFHHALGELLVKALAEDENMAIIEVDLPPASHDASLN